MSSKRLNQTIALITLWITAQTTVPIPTPTFVMLAMCGKPAVLMAAALWWLIKANVIKLTGGVKVQTHLSIQVLGKCGCIKAVVQWTTTVAAKISCHFIGLLRYLNA